MQNAHVSNQKQYTYCKTHWNDKYCFLTLTLIAISIYNPSWLKCTVYTPPLTNIPCMCRISTFALNYLTGHVIPCSTILLTSMEKNPAWEVVSPLLAENFPNFMKLEGSLPRTHEPATFSSSKPNEFVPNISLSDRFNIIFPSTSWSSKYLYIWVSRQNRVCIPFHTFHTHLSLFDFIGPLLIGDVNKPWSSSICNHVHACYCHSWISSHHRLSHYPRTEQYSPLYSVKRTSMQLSVPNWGNKWCVLIFVGVTQKLKMRRLYWIDYEL